jgi:two-component system OmpR family sensor kinase
MTSLRTRLIAWYLCAGALTVICVGLLAATALIEVGSFTVRQSMAAAAREAPALVEQYRAEHHTMNGVEPFLRQHFANSGLIIRVNEFGASPEMFRPGAPPPGTLVRMIPRREPPSLVRLLAMEIKPITAGFHGGEVVFFVDPVSLQGLFRHLGTFLIVLTVLVMLGAWRLAIVVAEKSLQPLVRTTDALNRFGSGDFTPESVRTEDRTELGELARAYNRAVDQITRALDARDRAAAEMRQFVADAGHQLRTPLTVIMAYVSGMANRPQSLRDAATFATLLQQSRRMKALIDELIVLARLEHPDAPSTEYVDLNELCAALPSQFDEEAQHRIAVSTSDVPAEALANETDLSFAFCALIDNALKYAPESNVEVAVQVRDGNAIVTVADRGPGMTASDMRNAFDRFYRGTASEGTEGTGLGLAIVRKSVERAGGSIVLEARTGGGLQCIIRLPVQASSKRAALHSNYEQRTYVYD